jgi:hypothetical protein
MYTRKFYIRTEKEKENKKRKKEHMLMIVSDGTTIEVALGRWT